MLRIVYITFILINSYDRSAKATVVRTNSILLLYSVTTTTRIEGETWLKAGIDCNKEQRVRVNYLYPFPFMLRVTFSNVRKFMS